MPTFIDNDDGINCRRAEGAGCRFEISTISIVAPHREQRRTAQSLTLAPADYLQ